MMGRRMGDRWEGRGEVREGRWVLNGGQGPTVCVGPRSYTLKDK